MRTGLYTVFDKVAGLVIGGVQLHRHEASAVRAFTDVCTMSGSIVSQHPSDFALVRLGWLVDADTPTMPTLEEDTAVVLDGETWSAAMYKAAGEPLGPDSDGR